MSAIARAQTACARCRERKVKCSGGQPCAKCAAHASECYYPPTRRTRRTLRGPASDLAVDERLARMESLLHRGLLDRSLSTDVRSSMSHARGPSPSTADLTCTTAGPGVLGSEHTASAIEEAPNVGFRPSSRATGTAGGLGLSQPSCASHPPGVSDISHIETPPLARTRPQHVSQVQAPADDHSADGEDLVMPLESTNCWEHHGPGAWVSICSEPGLRWVCARTGSTDFIDSAKGLLRKWTERLRHKNISRASWTPEPDEPTAFRYCTEYFDRCYDAGFGVIHRRSFEDVLNRYFQMKVCGTEDHDPSFLALRNVVYAAGYRSILANDPSVSFAEAQLLAWRYFENALSVLGDVLFNPTGLTAVQALTLMAFYVEGLGSPALEYMLCSNAVRMAQSKGLHLQPSKIWCLPRCEILYRTWLFWAVYCCDKQIAFRSGRPSAIDDDNISCQIPTESPPGSAADVELFTAMVRHAQISSRISKRLLSAKAFQQSPAELLASVSDLQSELERFRESLPLVWRPGTPITPSRRLGSAPSTTQVLYLHFAYYGSLIATNMLLNYPWISSRFGSDADILLRGKETLPSSTVANAARNIITSTKAIEINAATPAFLAFYYPILSHINLFVSVLKNAGLPTVNSDVALLDISAGHFAYMEYVTSSELAFPFVRDTAALARNAVKREQDMQSIRHGMTATLSRSDLINSNHDGSDHNNSDTEETLNAHGHDVSNLPAAILNELPALNTVDFDLFTALDVNALSGNGLDFFQDASDQYGITDPYGRG